MSDGLQRFDGWLKWDGPAALVLREAMMPVEGPDGVVFPATFASGDSFPGGYNVDTFDDGSNVCLIDTVGSQANRVEPLFAQAPCNGLVPQIVVTAGDKAVNLLEAGHRAGDAIVRCSSLQDQIQHAFQALLRGDAGPLAKIAPTSLVFGAWDSRETQAKAPRLFASTVRAFNVKRLTRSAQYVPAVDYVGLGVLEEGVDKAAKDRHAQRGFVHVPASASHGGVIATGGIRRDATLQLAALRLLKTTGGDSQTLALQRYVLGLALTAFTTPLTGYYRQGCTLVLDPSGLREIVGVHHDGRRERVELASADVLSYAASAASAFGVGPSMTVPFDSARAQADVSAEQTGGKNAKKAKAKKTE